MAMNNFTMNLATKVHFGKGQIEKLRGETPQNSRIMVTYGGSSIFKNGVIEQVREALKGFDAIEFGGIEPNPGFATLMRAVAAVKEHGVDFLLAVGGGSVLDGTKFIAAAALYEPEDKWEILLTGGAKVSAAIPLGCVLTLPATGSEMNPTSVISRYETGDKLSFSSPHVLPRFAVLDPEVTFSLPERQTANGIVDTFVHVAEQYMTYPVDAKIPDRFAEGVFCTLLEDGPAVMKNPLDYSARANIMWAATMGLNRILSTGVPQDWVSHAMGHEMTAIYGIDHARSLAITMPAVWQYCRHEKREKLLQFAARVLGITDGGDEERIDSAIARVITFFEDLGCATTFEDAGLDESKIPAMVQKLREHRKTGIGERGAVTPEDMERIYRLAVRR